MAKKNYLIFFSGSKNQIENIQWSVQEDIPVSIILLFSCIRLQHSIKRLNSDNLDT